MVILTRSLSSETDRFLWDPLEYSLSQFLWCLMKGTIIVGGSMNFSDFGNRKKPSDSSSSADGSVEEDGESNEWW